MRNFFLGYLLACLSFGIWAWQEVRKYQFNNLEYRKEIRAMLNQQNALMQGMINAGFVVISEPKKAGK